MQNKNTLSSILSYFTSEELTQTNLVNRLWCESSREAAKISLRRYLPIEIINSLLFPIQTLHCFERLFETPFIDLVFYEHCDLSTIRADYSVVLLFQHIICFPYLDEKMNQEFFMTIDNMNSREKKAIVTLAIALHNFKLLSQLKNQDINSLNINANAIIAANSRYLLHLMVLPKLCIDRNSALRALERSASLTFMQQGTDLLENCRDDDIDDIDATEKMHDKLIRKLRTRFNEGKFSLQFDSFLTARCDAELIFPNIVKIESFIKSNNLAGLEQFYYNEISNQDLVRATIAILLTCPPHIVKNVHDWEMKLLRLQGHAILAEVLILYAIRHNDLTFFNQLGTDIKRSAEILEHSLSACLMAISFYHSDNFYSVFAAQAVARVTETPIKMDFLQYDNRFADAFLNRFLEIHGLNEQLRHIIIIYGNVRLITKMFQHVSEQYPISSDLLTAIHANDPAKLDALIKLNPALKLTKNHLWLAIANDQLKMTIHLVENYLIAIDQITLNIAAHYCAASVFEYLIDIHKLIPDQMTTAILNNEEFQEFSDYLDESDYAEVIATLDLVTRYAAYSRLYSKSYIEHFLAAKGIKCPQIEL